MKDLTCPYCEHEITDPAVTDEMEYCPWCEKLISIDEGGL